MTQETEIAQDIFYHFCGCHQRVEKNESPYVLTISWDWENEMCNCAVISLEADLNSSLNWKKSLEKAREAVQKGFQIVWEFDLGLFHQLKAPLSDEGQYLALSFAIEHFTKVVSPEFKENTLGAILYKGKGDFSSQFSFPLEEEGPLFAQEKGSEYLRMMAASLPEGILPIVMVDAESFSSLGELLYFLSPERFPHLQLAVKSSLLDKSLLRLPFFSWKEDVLSIPESRALSKGLCLPPLSASQEIWLKMDEIFQQLKTLTLITTESALTYQWDGLESLIAISEAVTFQGKRKLKGFCAAGGLVETVRLLPE